MVSPLKRSAILASLALLLPLTACSGEALQRSLAPDPRLLNNAGTITADATSVELPPDFPTAVPRYPNAALQTVIFPEEASNTTSQFSGQGTITRWTTADSTEQVAQFYQTAFQQDGWQIEPSTNRNRSTSPSITATRDGLRVSVVFDPATNPSTPETVASPEPSPGATAPEASANVASETEFTLEYIQGNGAIANANNPTGLTGDTSLISGARPANADTPDDAPTPTGDAESPAGSPTNFTDINQAPEELRPYLEDLAQLGVLTPHATTTTTPSSNPTSPFKPNEVMTRRQFARWLVATNNALYANRPAQKIRLGSANAQPVFQDVSRNDPDFAVIQGLAEAGLIPSSLSGDATAVTFRPDAPLTREILVLWKTPLDVKGTLPTATVTAVQQSWGFQDANRINPTALRAVLADYQNGELSNIRRAFGYTTLLQPSKSVTRAEAASTLWYFGSQGDGISAQDALQMQQSENN